MLKKICLKGIQQGSGKGRDVFLRGNPGKNTRFYLMLSNPMCCSMRPQRWKRKHTETYWFCFHLWFLSSFCSEILKMETWPPFPKKSVKKASDFWRNWVSIYLAVAISSQLLIFWNISDMSVKKMWTSSILCTNHEICVPVSGAVQLKGPGVFTLEGRNPTTGIQRNRDDS